MSLCAVPWYSSPTASNAADCTERLSSTSGNAAGCLAGRCRKHILLASGCASPRRAAATPRRIPMVVASCSRTKYL